MEGTGNDLVLLFLCKLDEVHGIIKEGSAKARERAGEILSKVRSLVRMY